MNTPQIAPYGFWRSPITSDRIAGAVIRLGQVALDGEDVYWTELRPAEGGRSVLARRSADGSVTDRTPAPFNVRTRVHEYGGGAYVVQDGLLVFAHDADQRLYRQAGEEAPAPITPEGRYRYADLCLDLRRGRLICVREDHTREGQEPVNQLVSVDLKGQTEPAVLASGADFTSTPRLSPDGEWLAWLTWEHPRMPWDGTELWVAKVAADGRLARAERVAGGPEEAVLQPEWSPDGLLHFVSDRSGWWNLYRRGDAEPLVAMDAEFGGPHWIFGQSTYGFAGTKRIVCAFAQHGTWRLASLDLGSRALTLFDLPYSEISSVRVAGGRAAFLAASPTDPPSVVTLDLETGRHEVLRQATTIEAELRPYLSVPRAIEFPTEGGLTAHALYYPPHNPDFAAPEGERPPLLVKCHGGPTSATSSALSLSVQYWTSRGFALLDVNYGGSTGYGRAYRERLKGQWGVVDVDDCVNGARYLAEQGLVDRERMAISGGSAGGYTTLAALAFRDVFSAGASYYGVSDLEALARDTHKFEARYLDSLVGPYPERQDLYRERSPLHAADRIAVPVLFLQGAEDRVVPPSQTEPMVEALRARGIPAGYLLFEGEQHGFRRADNIRRALDAELYFYAILLVRTGLRF
jgi:dipeptidyl aminopeptidase/acylaminoacyl peptidase